MRIGISYNLKNDPSLPSPKNLVEDSDEEFDSPETIEAIRQVLAKAGHEVFLLGGDLTVVEKIKKMGIEFVFNIAEGYSGRSREAHIPALLEMMGIPYSGSDPLALALTLDKALTKRIVQSLSIPTPDFWVLDNADAAREIPERFPLFAKPAGQGSSKGIRRSSRINNRVKLREELDRLFTHYPEDIVMIEECIPGREFTLGMLGNDSPEVIGMMEISFRNKEQKDFCYSLEVKRNWREEVEYTSGPSLDPSIERGIRESSLRIFKTLGLRDVARIDFRVNESGQFYFLEVNPLPGLSPVSGDLVILAEKKGWSYEQLILKITQFAISRYR